MKRRPYCEQDAVVGKRTAAGLIPKILIAEGTEKKKKRAEFAEGHDFRRVQNIVWDSFP